MNGTKSKIYYAYSKDLKNVGAQFAFPISTNASGFADGDKAGIVILVNRSNQAKQVGLASLANDGGGNFMATNDSETTW